MRVLERLHIRNFRSIRSQELELGNLNVFIGGNGAGKTNLIQVFRLLKEIAARNLATYSLAKGADALLHFGRKASKDLYLKLSFKEGDLANYYAVHLIATDEGALMIGSEDVGFQDLSRHDRFFDEHLSGGAKEALIGTSRNKVAAYLRRDLENYRVYHFHDTSEAAAIKGMCPIADNRFLRPDASNLAAFLFWLKARKSKYFHTIEDTIRQIAPFFEGFDLRPARLNPDQIRLEWKEKGSDTYFNAHALSDGTLRFMCIATLLLQPEVPGMVLLDEPELGLHPAAITLLAELLASASTRTQILVSTQSVTLVNQLEPGQVWTVDRLDGQSVFSHLGRKDLDHWLDGYSLGELWEKNLLGGRP